MGIIDSKLLCCVTEIKSQFLACAVVCPEMGIVGHGGREILTNSREIKMFWSRGTCP